jgi:hypothetical protein
MSATLHRPGRPEHRCDLGALQPNWKALARCDECGSWWTGYGDVWLPEGPLGMASRWWRAIRRRG